MLNKRSVLYAGCLQFCFPGAGRLYLGDWKTGFLQFLSSFIGVGIIWSWIDGYVLTVYQLQVEQNGVDLVYHVNYQKESKSSIIGFILQLFGFGVGRVYKGSWSVGLLQLAFMLVFSILIYLNAVSRTSDILAIAHLLALISFFHLFMPCMFLVLFQLSIDVDRVLTWSEKFLSIGGLVDTGIMICGDMVKMIVNFFFSSSPGPWYQVYMLLIFISFVKLYFLTDSLLLLRGGFRSRYQEIIRGPKDRLIGGILQVSCPGLGRCYLGYWWIGFLQFISSFAVVGLIWSWVDGHRILLDPGLDKDNKRQPITDQYRLKVGSISVV